MEYAMKEMSIDHLDLIAEGGMVRFTGSMKNRS